YCWKTKPTFFRRKATRSPEDSPSGAVPRTERSPAVRSSRPAITEISVVFPQPLGPTRKLSSPKRASKSTPRSASMRVSRSPKWLRPPRQATARWSSLMRLGAEDFGRLEDEHAPDAQQAGHDHNEQDADAGQRHALPHEDDVPRGQLVLEDLEEGSGHA